MRFFVEDAAYGQLETSENYHIYDVCVEGDHSRVVHVAGLSPEDVELVMECLTQGTFTAADPDDSGAVGARLGLDVPVVDFAAHIKLPFIGKVQIQV